MVRFMDAVSSPKLFIAQDYQLHWKNLESANCFIQLQNMKVWA